ncbi:MAG: HrcA family transcriptional regulator, partial [Thermodesulfobacteriota bacterium]
IRVYIDNLVDFQSNSLQNNEAIQEQYYNIDGTLDQVVNNISYLLSDFTHTACLATLPSKKNMKIQSFKIVELGDRVCLVLVVFEGGITEKSYIKLDRKISSQQINQISDYVNNLTYGLTLIQLKDEILKKVKEPFNEYSTFIENLIKFSMDVLEKENKVEILINGNLSHLDYCNVDNLETSKSILHVFEKNEFLKGLMDSVVEENITKVFIGRYNGMPTGLSLIAAPYGKGINQGSLGVFGPIRMNYSEIIPLVNYTAEYLTNIVGNGGTNACWR